MKNPRNEYVDLTYFKQVECSDFDFDRSDSRWPHVLAYEYAPCSFCKNVTGKSCSKGHRVLTVNYNGHLLVQCRIEDKEPPDSNSDSKEQ